MKISDYIALIVIIAIVVLCLIYIIKQKKKGVKCIGCPHSRECKNCNCNTKK